MPRSVLLLFNKTKPDVVAALPEVRELIKRHGRLAGEFEANGSPLTTRHAQGADLIVVLGGDGTLMGQSRRCVHLGLPMLGVNLGKLGYMAEFDMPDLHTHGKSLFDGSPLLVQDRHLLRVLVDGETADDRQPMVDESALARTLAVNDVVITAGPPYRMISIGITIDGVEGPTITGDGLIVSTAIGSTAYNASAGGAIISPEVEALALTPLAAQSLAFRPVVIPARSSIELAVHRANDDPSLPGLSGGTALVLDGQVSSRVRSGQIIRIRQHARPVRFVRNPQSSYLKTLITKMRWAAPPATRGQ